MTTYIQGMRVSQCRAPHATSESAPHAATLSIVAASAERRLRRGSPQHCTPPPLTSSPSLPVWWGAPWPPPGRRERAPSCRSHGLGPPGAPDGASWSPGRPATTMASMLSMTLPSLPSKPHLSTTVSPPSLGGLREVRPARRSWRMSKETLRQHFSPQAPVARRPSPPPAAPSRV